MTKTLYIRDHRQRVGMSLATLAVILDVTPASVCAWEYDRALPTADKLPAIAAALGVTVDDLYRPDDPAQIALDATG